MHPIHHHIINRRNVLLFCAVVLLAFAFWYFQELQSVYGSLERVFERLAQYNQLLAGGVFVLLTIASAMVSFFTTTPLVPAASHIWGRNTTFLLLFGSWILGGLLAYGIAYHAQKFVKKLGVYKKAEHYIEHLDGHSEFTLALLFRLAVPSEVGAYTLGLLRYKFWKYILITIFSELPFAILAIYSSEALISRQPILFTFEIAGAIVFIGVTLYFFHQLLNKKSEPSAV